MSQNLYSMTGFGESTAQIGDYLILCRVRSVNNRGLEIRTRLPRSDLFSLEKSVRELIAQELKRGSIDFSLSIEENNAGESAPKAKLNHELAKQYADAFHSLKKMDLKIQDDIIAQILRMPGVFETHNQKDEQNKLEEFVKSNEKSILDQVCSKAILQLKEQRSKEGASLQKYFDTILSDLNQSLSVMRSVYEQEKKRTQETLTSRANETLKLLHSISKESGDFATRLRDEIVFYLQREDVSEELSRLDHHIQSFRNLLQNNSKDGVGRKMEFIQQEMHREINTLGSKLTTELSSATIIHMKTCLDRIREQIANVE